MIKREMIERLPTVVRDAVKGHLEVCIKKAEQDKRDASDVYVITTEEAKRAQALIAQGELNAFTALFNLFK